MTHVSWAALYEGATDQAYFELLIPRVMEEIIMLHGTRHSTIPPAPAVILKRAAIDRLHRKLAIRKTRSTSCSFMLTQAGMPVRPIWKNALSNTVRPCMSFVNGLPFAELRSHPATKPKLGYLPTRTLSPPHSDIAGLPTPSDYPTTQHKPSASTTQRPFW